MKIVFAIPTADVRKCSATFARWKALGYMTAALTDGEMTRPDNCDYWVWQAEYKGYAASVNRLARMAVEHGADIVVTGGDDVFPVAGVSAEEIGRQFQDHFPDLMGVMEPTGDRHMVDAAGTCAAERVCIAPWMGREWVRRGYGGKGPLFEGYHHFFVDNDLKHVAEKLGILWQRPDLTQFHDHWTRGGERPTYLDKAVAGWADAKALFESREAAGFPGHEPLAAK